MKEEKGGGGKEGGREGGLRETASEPHRHLDSAAMFFCRLIKQPRGRKRRRLPREREEATEKEKEKKEEEENLGERRGRGAEGKEVAGKRRIGEGELVLGGGVTTRREREQREERLGKRGGG